MRIRSATLSENCKYVLENNQGIILKKYFEEDEPVDFTEEVKKAIQDSMVEPDSDKVAMAETIIEIGNELALLTQRINNLEGVKNDA